MSQIRRDRVAFFPPLGIAALVDGPVQFLAQRLRPSAGRGANQGTPRRWPRTLLQDATRKVVRIATIDIDREPWWLHFRRRR